MHQCLELVVTGVLKNRPDGGWMVEDRRLIERPLAGPEIDAGPPVLQPHVESSVDKGVHHGDRHGGTENVGPHPRSVNQQDRTPGRSVCGG